MEALIARFSSCTTIGTESEPRSIAQSIAYRGEGAPSNGKLDFHEVEKGWEQLTFQGKGTDFGREILSGNGSMSRSREARR
jgi:hypothetical protein